MGDIRYRPLYSCWRCGEDRTLPAEELRVCPTGDLSCLDCWEDDRSEEEGAFRDLPAFVPESDAEIARLREEVERLKKERDEARERLGAYPEMLDAAESRLAAAESANAKLRRAQWPWDAVPPMG